MNKLTMALSAGLFALGTAASAATLTVVGGTAGNIPGGGTNNVLTDLLGINTLSGTFGSEIQYTGGANSKVRVEVMGFEATFLNSFEAGGTTFDTPGSTAPGLRKQIGNPNPLATWTTSDVVGNLLDFSFGTSGKSGGTPFTHVVENGSLNTEADTAVNFFVHDDGKYIWLFFDDRGSSTDDDNHDDLVVRLSAVPLPAGALLMLTGLGALALRRRKS